MNDIMTQITTLLAPLDERLVKETQDWAEGRLAAIAEFKKTEEYKQLIRDQYRLYAKLFAMAGGKTWYNALWGRNKQMVVEFVEKHCNSIARKRNEKIAAKLEKAGVKSVISQEFVHTADGFNGVFRVDTDMGVKVVIIETIIAGGYNIQCAHMRVLVRVK